MINFQWYSFPELKSEKLYAILSLRSEVFSAEQKCTYQDVDGKDFSALHLLGQENDSLMAYLRLFKPNLNENRILFGRVVVAPLARRKGYGKKLLEELLNHCHTKFPNTPIKCSAQYYLKDFYESFGFSSRGDIYIEAGIPHIEMLKDPNSNTITEFTGKYK